MQFPTFQGQNWIQKSVFVPESRKCSFYSSSNLSATQSMVTSNEQINDNNNMRKKTFHVNLQRNMWKID